MALPVITKSALPWGLSGVAKIAAGWRPLAWVATHRLVDYLRLVCWW